MNFIEAVNYKLKHPKEIIFRDPNIELILQGGKNGYVYYRDLDDLTLPLAQDTDIDDINGEWIIKKNNLKRGNIMIPIKIRAYDKAQRTMKYPVPYDNGDGKCPDELKGKFCPAELEDKNGHRSHISDVLMNSDLYVPMLFSGRKDANNQEIYNKDIVEYCGKNCLILFWNAHFIVCSELSGEHEDLWKAITRDPNLKIIGNIFEDPELFNDTKAKQFYGKFESYSHLPRERQMEIQKMKPLSTKAPK